MRVGRVGALLLCVGASLLHHSSSLSFSVQRQDLSHLPVIDETTSLAARNPDGTVSVQTVTHVDVGRASSDPFPACVGPDVANPAATCVNLCVTIPPGSKVTNIEGIASEKGPDGQPFPHGPCTLASCFGQRPELSKAMFDPAGPTRTQRFGMDAVCWVFRSWHPTKPRTAFLKVSYHSPPREQWRDVDENAPWLELQSMIERITGRDPIDCGQHRETHGRIQSGEQPRQDSGALTKSLNCAKAASEKKLPFWTAKANPGIDTVSYVGLLGQRDGSFHVFNACRSCSPDFSMKWCLVPEIQTDAGGRSNFGCAKWAIR